MLISLYFLEICLYLCPYLSLSLSSRCPLSFGQSDVRREAAICWWRHSVCVCKWELIGFGMLQMKIEGGGREGEGRRPWTTAYYILNSLLPNILRRCNKSPSAPLHRTLLKLQVYLPFIFHFDSIDSYSVFPRHFLAPLDVLFPFHVSYLSLFYFSVLSVDWI